MCIYLIGIAQFAATLMNALCILMSSPFLIPLVVPALASLYTNSIRRQGRDGYVRAWHMSTALPPRECVDEKLLELTALVDICEPEPCYSILTCSQSFGRCDVMTLDACDMPSTAQSTSTTQHTGEQAKSDCTATPDEGNEAENVWGAPLHRSEVKHRSEPLQGGTYIASSTDVQEHVR